MRPSSQDTFRNLQHAPSSGSVREMVEVVLLGCTDVVVVVEVAAVVVVSHEI